MDSPWQEGPVPEPSRYDHWRDIPYMEGPSDPMQTLWLSCPKGITGFPTVVWFHGGGMIGDGHECPPILYDGRCAVVEVRYRISPAVKAPAYHEDAVAAVTWVLDNIESYGGDPSHVFVGGMSAGAYLAAIVCMDPDWLAPHKHTPQHLAGLILVSGQMSTHFQVKVDLNYPGDRFLPAIDELAPLSYLSPELPPICLITGQSGMDIQARPEENAYMAASLRAMGHPHVECYHLSGHGHGGTFRSCDVLVERFLNNVLGPVEES